MAIRWYIKWKGIKIIQDGNTIKWIDLSNKSTFVWDPIKNHYVVCLVDIYNPWQRFLNYFRGDRRSQIYWVSKG